MRTVIVVCVVVLVIAGGLAYAVGLVTVDHEHSDGKYVLSLTVNTAMLSHNASTAHDDTPSDALSEASGKITAVRPDQNEIVVSENLKNLTFQLAKNGKVFINDRASTLAELLAGDDAVVSYDRQGENLVAHAIRSIRK